MANPILENLPRPMVKLVAPDDGNVFAILYEVSTILQKAGWTAEQAEAFLDEACSGDRNNALATCMKYLDVR